MIPAPANRSQGPRGFRWKLLIAMMLVVTAITTAGLYVAQRQLRLAAESEMERGFQSRLAAWQGIHDARQEALKELARTLARKPRLHAALEDNALDLLYLSARDELRDVMATGASRHDPASRVRTARFFRFLDAKGMPIPPPNVQEAGVLTPAEEAQLVLKELPRVQHLGFLTRHAGTEDESLDEIISVPIASTESGETIAALVLGFPPVDPFSQQADSGVHGGIWFEGRLYAQGIAASARNEVEAALRAAATELSDVASHLSLQVGGVPHLLLHRLLNPDSLYLPAHEIYLIPLADLMARQRQLRWNILGAGSVMLLIGLLGSHYAAARLSVPVERLAEESEEHLAQRQMAESALEQTNVELQRTARFSADASHQLKTPVAVLRAGLENLLSRESLEPEVREELSELLHQTHRLSGLIGDLLLLSRMEGGRLRLELLPVELGPLLEAALDDLSAQAEGLDLAVETALPPGLVIAGESRYTAIIVHNLLDNARKYNRAGGRIRVAEREEGRWIFLTVANTGGTIPASAQPYIFDRFHRGAAGENIPGHGLGLNLARELARLHGGELRLVTSADGWTEFEVKFRHIAAAATLPGRGA